MGTPVPHPTRPQAARCHPPVWGQLRGCSLGVPPCFGINCVPLNSYFGVLAPESQNVIIFGDSTFKGVMKAK